MALVMDPELGSTFSNSLQATSDGYDLRGSRLLKLSFHLDHVHLFASTQ